MIYRKEIRKIQIQFTKIRLCQNLIIQRYTGKQMKLCVMV